MGQIGISIIAPQRDVPRKTQHHFYGVPNRNARPESNHEVIADKSNIDILPSIWLVLFRNVNIKKNKAKPRNGCYLRVSFTIKKLMTIGKPDNKVCRLENNSFNVN